MRQLQVNDSVRVIHGVPNDFLPVGAVGVIQSIWDQQPLEYDVEFRIPGTNEAIREVLEADQIEWVEQAMPCIEPPPEDTTS